MPREKKKRGRREDKKRKRDEEEDSTNQGKRSKTEDEDDEEVEIKLDGDAFGYQDDAYAATNEERPAQEFYGLLDEDEQAYFKRAAQMLDLNEFATGSTEERDALIAGVWRECQDKELKVASSQSCSRLMEKLIQYASSEQLKTLFQRFGQHFTYLIQHRFASHCCEALFKKAALLVTDELLTPFEIVTAENEDNASSTETLFLNTVSELQGNFGFLMTDPFASHSVRILLLVLSGRSFSGESTQALLQSKKKETRLNDDTDIQSASRAVPASFQLALEGIVQDMVGNLDTNYLRALTTHPIGNPVLQLLLEIEFGASGNKKSTGHSLFDKLFPDLTTAKDTDSINFLRGLLFDPIGSHLLDTIVRHCPGKVFKQIWNGELRSSIVRMVKNDSAIHILARAIERLSPEDLQETTDQILPEVSALMERMQYSTIKLLIDRMLVRKLDTKPILDAISQHLTRTGVMQELKLSVDHLKPKDEEAPTTETRDPGKQRLSIFLQAMLDHEGPVQKLLFDTFTSLTSEELETISKDKYATFFLQQSLVRGDKIYRRVITQKLSTVVLQLIYDDIGSHLLESIWKATTDLQFLRERIAKQLAEHEHDIRDSHSGRFVWRSWMMDLFVRRKQSWIEKSKQADQLAMSTTTQSKTDAPREPGPQTGIAAARERFAANKASFKPGMNNVRSSYRAAVA